MAAIFGPKAAPTSAPIIIPPVAPPDRFNACLSFTLSEEGGMSLDPNDPGNWTGDAVGSGTLLGTNMGISAGAYPKLDIPNLTRDQAAEIYRRDYWNPCGCPEMPAGVDLCVFDAAVNCGVRRSVEMLQKAVLVTADGHVGPETLAAVNDMPPNTLAVILTAAREHFYATMQDSARYAKALDGRADRCLLAAQGLIKAAKGALVS